MSSFLDITFLLQIAHFAAAYCILVHFFLRPAYAHYMQLHNERKRRNDYIKAQEELLNKQRQEKVAELVAMQRSVLTTLPDNSYTNDTKAEEAYQFSPAVLSDSEKKSIALQVVARIKERILNE